jgi:hypothetical protein
MKIKPIFLMFAFALYFGAYTSSAQTQTNDNEKVADLIAKKRAYNKRKGFGYRIQLYNGSENRAKSIRGKFRVEFPNIKTYLKYNAPEWKIQVGNYKTTLEADKALMGINMKFSGAIVIPISK